MMAFVMIPMFWFQPANAQSASAEMPKTAVVYAAGSMGCDCGCACCKDGCCGGQCGSDCCKNCPCGDGCCAGKAGARVEATPATAPAKTSVAARECCSCCGGNCEACCGGNCGACCGAEQASRG